MFVHTAEDGSKRKLQHKGGHDGLKLICRSADLVNPHMQQSATVGEMIDSRLDYRARVCMPGRITDLTGREFLTHVIRYMREFQQIGQYSSAAVEDELVLMDSKFRQTLEDRIAVVERCQKAQMNEGHCGIR